MIKRKVFKDLIEELENKKILFLLGARQVGKTTILNNLKKYLDSKNKNSSYFNLEIPRDMLKFKGTEEDVFNLLTSSYKYIFIDEFHYLKNASHLFKAVYDSSYDVKIIATGSSSLEIHKHLKESLAGRRNIYKIYPFTYEEYLETGKDLNTYLIEGGMPGLCEIKNEDKRNSYLKELVETYILKDVKSLIKEENILAFNNLIYILAQNQGQLIKNSQIANEIKVSKTTVDKYLQILEQTYVCYSLNSYSNNLANELKKSKKYYFFDIGIRNSIISAYERDIKNRVDKGTIYESFVFLSLLKQLKAKNNLYFWRTKKGYEVDFIWTTNRDIVPIEVKANWNKSSIPNGLKLFLSRYKNVEMAFIFSNAQEKTIIFNGIRIYIMSFTKIDNFSKIIENKTVPKITK